MAEERGVESSGASSPPPAMSRSIDRPVLRTASFSEMYARFARQITPTGVIPNYGDSGSARRAASTGNYTGPAPWACVWSGFVAGFVRAGCEYRGARSGAFMAAARAVFAGGTALQPLGSAYGDVGHAFRLLYAVSWGAAAPPPDPGAFAAMVGGSGVLTRRDAHGPATPATVVLHSNASRSMVLSDLYASQIPVPPHAHENQHGQVIDSHSVQLTRHQNLS